jgi:predicted nucleic acid-binding protein
MGKAWKRRNSGIGSYRFNRTRSGHTIDTRLSLYAADMALQHRLSFADAIIYASAIQFDVPLITADDHFKDLPEVIFFSKKSGARINHNTKTPADRWF